ncbi:hypothetical protein M441DRAFT_444513 [Trichoderma asperellum CBS 433.97]|uniref:Uncharacterized protein n=1 Tax=Trichoderma asperellum (strain ATCC 204424 / CBS 433.97 / NBRC 101777) TaxID=1042311 RepID=A0A2T3ZMG7_TRIA4|nr:hypothetical protein M441DRAFT_444513 [Trichoderma asperellum CBS 433.97]PTB45998.1 hypothetical protein M441DRAFT_444513 [Trichoderma asperellum CBS 433.97]
MLMRHSPLGCIRNGERYAVCGLGGPGSHGQHGLAAVTTAGSGAVMWHRTGPWQRAQRDDPPVGHVAHRHLPPRTAAGQRWRRHGLRYLGVHSGEQQQRRALNAGRQDLGAKIVGFAPFASASTLAMHAAAGPRDAAARLAQRLIGAAHA